MGALRWAKDARWLMVSMLLLAVVFAVGHDQFYANLSGMDPDRALFSQQHNIAIGNAFAICVKAALCYAVSTAYAQLLWAVLLKHEQRVKTVDSLSSLTTSLWSMFDITLFARYPVLAITATVYWTLFFSILFPPGSLSLALVEEKFDGSIYAPSVDWSQDRLADRFDWSVAGSGSNSSWDGTYFVTPQMGLTPVINYLANVNDYPPVRGALSNSSYGQEFQGPSIQCTTAPWTQPLVDMICDGEEHYFIAYASWLSLPAAGSSFFGLDGNSTYTSANGSTACSNMTAADSKVRVANRDQTLYVATRNSTTTDLPYNWHVTSCVLGTAYYTVDLNFNNSVQRINYTASEHQNNQPLDQWIGQNSTALASLTEMNGPARVASNYLAVFAAFSQLTSGLVVEGGDTRLPAIFDSPLITTDELKAILAGGTSLSVPNTWQQNNSDSYGIISGRSAGSGKFYVPGQAASTGSAVGMTGPLGPALETFFRRMTIAVVTGAQYGSHKSFDMKIYESSLQYAYHQQNLWLSYGIGIGVTMLLTALGIWRVHVSHASYSTRFSTYMRMLMKTELETKAGVRFVDQGSDPLPAEIRKAMIRLGPSRSEEEAPMQSKTRKRPAISNDEYPVESD